MGRFCEADFSRLEIGSVAERSTRVRVEDFAGPVDPDAAQECSRRRIPRRRGHHSPGILDLGVIQELGDGSAAVVE